ncbi:MAG: AAA family ATPase [bacterium]|nr:AAA family ATPase [bacterium]
MALGAAAPPGYLPRVVDQQMTSALRSSPAVVVEGPRACGKTWTARTFANSMMRFDELEPTRLSLEVNPSSFLAGDTPRLLDEWHLADGLWNAMRHACDERAANGQFILAGSVKPTYAVTDHSGAGRVARVRMRPMALFESGDSAGSISLESLMAGGPCAGDPPDDSLSDIAALV